MKYLKLIFLIIIFVSFSKRVFCQTVVNNERVKLLGIDASLNSFAGNIENSDKIRANISYFDSNLNSLKSFFSKSYTGIKGEIRSKNNTFSLTSGLRYSHISSLVAGDRSSSSSFFYFLINSEGTTTEYLRVEEITQKNDYLGVPIEFKFVPVKDDFVKAYVKIGFEFAFSLQDKIDVVFYDSSMDSRKNEFGNKLKKSDSYYSYLYPSCGLELGNVNKPSVSIELSTPSFFLNKNISTLITPTAGIGFQINFQIPLNKISINQNDNQNENQ